VAGAYITETGSHTADELFGPGGRERMERNGQRWAERVDESWGHLLSDWVMNGMYSRNVLPTATRELIAVAALTALGRWGELEGHVRIALRSNPPEHVREAILQMAVYGGVPVALEGLHAFERIIAEE
jgi:4-carboxymuconolactone decarboxylase